MFHLGIGILKEANAKSHRKAFMLSRKREYQSIEATAALCM